MSLMYRFPFSLPARVPGREPNLCLRCYNVSIDVTTGGSGLYPGHADDPFSVRGSE